jgi:hypothetical protein
MAMKKNGVLFFSCLCLLQAKEIRLIAPYFGSVRNQLSVEMMDDLKDTAPLGGIYFQWIQPEKYQWNVFLYQSRDINYSDIFGSHFIVDYYPGRCPCGGLLLVGAGFDYIGIKTDGDVSPGVSEFTMTTHIYAPYFRFGRYIDFGSSVKKVSLLPWGGIEMDMIRGDLGFIVPSMFPGMTVLPVDKEIKNEYTYALIGLNGKATLYHFSEVSVKYYRKFSLNNRNDLNVFSAMLNIYFNRHWGLSYRLKYMEVSVSTNTYHMVGAAFIF